MATGLRPLFVALAAAALLLAPATALHADAVEGYDSAYVGESAFVSLTPGDSNEFQVFFQNAGTVTWIVGSSTQVDLAACLADKVTCDVAPVNAAWNPGGMSAWLSTTRYATTSQSSVVKGGVATFKYTVKVPASATAGTYRFNGDLVVKSSGAPVHPEGYFQEATVTIPVVVTKPTLVSAVSQNSTEILLTFSADMNCSSLTLGTYTIKDSSGTAIDTGATQVTVKTNSTSGTGATDCRTASLLLRESASVVTGLGASYTVAVSGVTSSAGIAIDPGSSTAAFAAADAAAPTALTATILTPSIIRTTFSEPMNQASTGTGIANTANYRVDGLFGPAAYSSCASVQNGLASDCTLITAFQTSSAGSHTFNPTAVTDASGKTIVPDPTVLSATYPPITGRPTLKSAASSSVTSLVLTFDRNMNTASSGTGCANGANYSIQNSDGSSASVNLSASCSTNVATLTLTGATSGTKYNVVVTGVADSFGNVITPNPTTMSFNAGSDTTPPSVIATTSPALNVACDVTSPAPCQRSQFTVMFSEPMNLTTSNGSAIVTTGYSLKDASGVVATISICSAIDARNVATSATVTCVLKTPVPAGSYTLTIGAATKPQDAAGNTISTSTATLTLR